MEVRAAAATTIITSSCYISGAADLDQGRRLTASPHSEQVPYSMVWLTSE